jgi:uncharacterized damage-inducible protein DinB
MEREPLDCLRYGYDLNTRILPALVEEFSEEQFRQERDGARCALWLAGHLAATRRSVLEMLSVKRPARPWDEHFTRHSDPTPRDDWPAPGEVLDDFREGGSLISQRLKLITASQFAAEHTSPITGETATLAHQVQFFLFHESYHVGQVGYVRAQLGYPYLA